MTTALITREYNGNVFHFREDGYFNMTKAAKAFGKEVKEFLRLPATVEYVAALEKVGISHVYEARQGRNGGTWGHPKFAVSFARWLDVQFAVFCDMVIDDILNKKAELTITKPAESMAMKVPQSFPEALRLAAELAEKNEKLQHRVDHLTVREYEREMGLYLRPGLKQRFSRIASDYCRSQKLELTKTPMKLQNGDVMVECEVNVYPREALDHAAFLLRLA